MTTRRTFIKNSIASSAVISLSGSVPQLLLSATHPSVDPRGNKILVVIQLSGGNDGLNTVVPYADDNYYKNRFTLAIAKNNVLKIDNQVGLHPALKGFDRMLESKQLSIVQGVGYPQPNRSHFESMDLWHTAHQKSELRDRGWLGHAVDRFWTSDDLPAIHLGNGLQPLALKTSSTPAPTIRSLEDFKLNLFRNAQTKKAIQKIMASPPNSKNHPLLGYIHDSANVAIKTSQRLENLRRSSASEFGYPPTSLGKNLNLIARLIGSGLSTRIYYTTLDGFDTHSKQADAHRSLLTDLANATSAFQKELTQQGNDHRVATFAFSEFGRRVRENASGGTDHGTAGPVFVFGSSIKHNVVGQHPSLNDLDQGDLKFKIDYRQVYSDLLGNWLGVNAESILGQRFEPVGLF